MKLLTLFFNNLQGKLPDLSALTYLQDLDLLEWVLWVLVVETIGAGMSAVDSEA